jgi:hypothetical protein
LRAPVDDVCGHASLGEAPGVGAVVVVFDEVLVEVLLERRALGNERSCEGRAAALFEDGELDALDAAVAVRAPGADESLLGAQLGDGVAELAGAELRSVVGGDLAQLPVGGGELCGDAVQQLAGVPGAGVAL